MNQIHVLCDLQYGSTGKGALAAFLGQYLKPGLALAAWGPNAGHTSYDRHGVKHVHTMLPNSVTMGTRLALLGPGSCINPEALAQEVHDCGNEQLTLVIHPNACVVTDVHREREREFVRIGSTMKGTAAAVMDKIARDPGRSPLFIDWRLQAEGAAWFDDMHDLCTVVSGHREYANAFNLASEGLLEGAQGFSLGYHTQFWPHCTGRDVSPYQMLADCRVPMQRNRPIVWGTARTYPIRVANRYEDGRMIGTSGPGYADQMEIQWSSIGREPELTTVTKLPRRLFTFSDLQMRDACGVARPDLVVLTFCDYICAKPAPGDRIPKDLFELTARINRACERDTVRFLSFGPRIEDTMLYDWNTGTVEEVTPAKFHLALMNVTHGV